MQNLKPFDPNEVDETLTRVVTPSRDTYLLFPYIDATSSAPKFNSVGCMIRSARATAEDFKTLSQLIAQAARGAVWFISFNTPWLIRTEDIEDAAQSRNKRSASRQ